MTQMLKQIPWSKFGQYLPAISFQWPTLLWLMLLVPLTVPLYFFLLRGWKKFAMRYGILAMVRQAAATPSWKRHIPPALFLAAFTLLILAVARPSAEVSLPSTR